MITYDSNETVSLKQSVFKRNNLTCSRMTHTKMQCLFLGGKNSISPLDKIEISSNASQWQGKIKSTGTFMTDTFIMS